MKNATFKKLSYALGAIITVLVAASLTVVLLKIYGPPIKPTPTANVILLPSLGDELKASLKNPTNVTVLINTSNSSAVLITPLGNRNWATVDNGSNILEFSSRRDSAAASENDSKNAIEVLVSKGFEEQSITDGTVRYFVSSGIACNLRNAVQAGVYSVRVDCANKVNFAKNTEAVTPFVIAYNESAKNAHKDGVFSNSNIQNSVTKNYKNASLRYSQINNLADSSVATFYQTPDTKWHFFTTASSLEKINCSDYNTSDLTNAFLGFSCWDSTTNAGSFVKTNAPTFEIVPDSKG